MRFSLTACLLAAPVATLAAQDGPPALKAPLTLTAADSARYLELGRTYTRWFLAGQADSLVAVTDPAALEKMGGPEGIQTVMEQVTTRAGIELAVVEEKLTRRRGALQFWHAGNFSELTTDQLVIRWLIDEHGKITGAGIGPRSNAPPVD
ncbi:MAG: hypothetical protein H0W15_05845 [Gemmatimonadales bacterium]|nr:hypothetical protein [Gemmatimonadales bacterium]